MAEQIVNEFTVNRPIAEAWPIICDVERIAPCMPGAQLEEIEGDTYRGSVKVKLGAITAQFKGEAHFVERDDAAHTAKLTAKGRDTGGRGNADADIYATAEELSPTSTKVRVTTDLHITGKVAQFSRGIMGDVSKKLVDRFASNLNELLDDQATSTTSPDGAKAGSAGSAASSAGAAANKSASTSKAATDGSNVRKIDGPAAEPVDLAGVAGPALVKRIAPAVAVLLLLVVLLRRRK